MEPQKDTNQGKTTLASPQGAARTVSDELKQGQSGPQIGKPQVAGTVVDPAEVMPPIVPARRAPSRKWLLAAVLVVCAAVVAVLVAMYGR